MTQFLLPRLLLRSPPAMRRLRSPPAAAAGGGDAAGGDRWWRSLALVGLWDCFGTRLVKLDSFVFFARATLLVVAEKEKNYYIKHDGHHSNLRGDWRLETTLKARDYIKLWKAYKDWDYVNLWKGLL